VTRFLERIARGAHGAGIIAVAPPMAALAGRAVAPAGDDTS